MAADSALFGQYLAKQSRVLLYMYVQEKSRADNLEEAYGQQKEMVIEKDSMLEAYRRSMELCQAELKQSKNETVNKSIQWGLTSLGIGYIAGTFMKITR